MTPPHIARCTLDTRSPALPLTIPAHDTDFTPNNKSPLLSTILPHDICHPPNTHSSPLSSNIPPHELCSSSFVWVPGQHGMRIVGLKSTRETKRRRIEDEGQATNFGECVLVRRTHDSWNVFMSSRLDGIDHGRHPSMRWRYQQRARVSDDRQVVCCVFMNVSSCTPLDISYLSTVRQLVLPATLLSTSCLFSLHCAPLRVLTECPLGLAGVHEPSTYAI